MSIEQERPGASPSGPDSLGAAARVALCIPLLGMVGTFVAIGWRDSPWVPLGVSAAVAVMLVAARWRTRRGRRMLEADRAEGRRVLNAHAARVGQAMVRITAVWIACSILLVIVLLGSRL